MISTAFGGLVVGIFFGFLVGKLHTIAGRAFRDAKSTSALAKGLRQRRWPALGYAAAIYVGVGVLLVLVVFGRSLH